METHMEYQVKKMHEWVNCSKSTYKKMAKENPYNVRKRNLKNGPHWEYEK